VVKSIPVIAVLIVAGGRPQDPSNVRCKACATRCGQQCQPGVMLDFEPFPGHRDVTLCGIQASGDRRPFPGVRRGVAQCLEHLTLGPAIGRAVSGWQLWREGEEVESSERG
jgi:hypothetical protein